MEPEFWDLAVTSAKTLISAMTTSGWDAVKGSFLTLWKRHVSAGEAGAVADDMEATRASLQTSDGVERGTAESEAVAQWASRLSVLVAQHESAVADLRRLAARRPEHQSNQTIQLQQSRIILRNQIMVGPHGTLTITPTAVAGLVTITAILLFIAILVVWLVLRPDQTPSTTSSASSSGSNTAAGPPPNSCSGLPQTGRPVSASGGTPSVEAFVYKVTTGEGAVAHQILPGGYIQQAFVSGKNTISQVSAIIGSADQRSHPLQFELLTSAGHQIVSAPAVQDSSNNNADTVVNIDPPVRAGRDAVLILRVINKSSETLGFYLNNPAGQLVPSPFIACLVGEKPDPSKHPDLNGWILAGSVTGRNNKVGP